MARSKSREMSASELSWAVILAVAAAVGVAAAARFVPAFSWWMRSLGELLHPIIPVLVLITAGSAVVTAYYTYRAAREKEPPRRGGPPSTTFYGS